MTIDRGTRAGSNSPGRRGRLLVLLPIVVAAAAAFLVIGRDDEPTTGDVLAPKAPVETSESATSREIRVDRPASEATGELAGRGRETLTIEVALAADHAAAADPLAHPIVLHLGDGRRTATLSVRREVDAEGNATIATERELTNGVMWRGAARQVGSIAVVDGLMLPSGDAWYAGARSVRGDGAILEAPSVLLDRGSAGVVRLDLRPPVPREGRLLASARLDGERLSECVVDVREPSGLTRGRHRFVQPDPTPVAIVAGVPLFIELVEARGLDTLGAPPPQTVTIAPEELAEADFDLVPAAVLHVRAETPRGEAVDGDLILWTDVAGSRRALIMSDGFEHRGAWGWLGRLALGRYDGIFVPRTEWPRRTFSVDIDGSSAEPRIELELAHDDGSALLDIHVRDADGSPLREHRMTWIREANHPGELDWAHLRTDLDGRAVLRPITPGSWRVVDYERGVAQTIDVKAGAANVDFRLPPTPDGPGRLEVHILDAAGKVLPLAYVYVRSALAVDAPPDSPARWWRIARPGRNETATIDGLAPGDYDVRVPTELTRFGDLGEATSHVRIPDRETATAVTLRLPRR